MENVLVLVRHGESEWNKLNLFTGWRDPDLTETGIEEAHRAGVLLKKEANRLRHRLYERAEKSSAHARHHPGRAGPEGS